MANKTEELVEALASPIAESLGLFIYDVEFKKEGPDYYLRVFIDRE
jgi:ribosome maturation factor RimP